MGSGRRVSAPGWHTGIQAYPPAMPARPKRPTRTVSRSSFFDHALRCDVSRFLGTLPNLFHTRKNLLQAAFRLRRNNERSEFATTSDADALAFAGSFDQFREFLFSFK